MKNDNNESYLSDLKEIRSMMERSSRFLSLSGLSGIMAGVIAMVGTGLAYWYMQDHLGEESASTSLQSGNEITLNMQLFLILDALVMITLALGFGIYFGYQKSKKLNIPFWNKSAELTVWNLLIPLLAGGLFCIVLLSYRYYLLIAPCTLIFYGLALINASKYTLHEVRYLGLCEIILGLLCSIFYYQTLLFWALGFGLLHILYGAIMYYRYER